MRNLRAVAWGIEEAYDVNHLGWCILSALDRAVEEGEGVSSIEELTKLLEDEAGVSTIPRGDFE